MLNYNQFDALIVTPALAGLQLDTEGFHILINGTVAHESKGGTYIKQLQGPALGICQMEPATHDSIWQAYLPNQSIISHRLMTLCSFARAPKSSQMINDMLYAVSMCAILYKWRIDSHRQDYPKTLEEAAEMWKAYYNTINGKGTVEQFCNDYRQFTGSAKPTKGKGNS